MTNLVAPADAQLAALALVGIFCAIKLTLDLKIIAPLEQIDESNLSRAPSYDSCVSMYDFARDVCFQACAY
jgi:hypothetical protein